MGFFGFLKPKPKEKIKKFEGRKLTDIKLLLSNFIFALLSFAVLALPFIFNRNSFEFVGKPKETFIFIVIAISLLLIFYYIFLSEKIIIKKSPISIFVLLFIVFGFLVFLASSDKYISFFAESNSFLSFYHILIYGILFFLFFLFGEKTKNIDILNWIITAYLLLLDIVFFLIIIGILTPPGYFLGSYTSFVYFVGFVLTANLGFIFFRKTNDFILNFLRNFSALFTFLLFLIFVPNFKILWLLLFVCVSFMFFTLVLFFEQKRVFVLFGILIFLVVYYFFPPNIKNIPLNYASSVIFNNPIEIGLSHQFSYKLALSAIKDSPLFGKGFGYFPLFYQQNKDISIYTTSFWNVNFKSPSNLFSLMIIEGGIVLTLIFYLLLLYSIFIFFKKILGVRIFSNITPLPTHLIQTIFQKKGEISTKGIEYILIISLFYLIILSLFNPLNFTFGVFLFSLLGIIASFSERTASLDMRTPSIRFLTNLVLFSLIVLLTVFAVYEVRRFMAFSYIQKALLSSNIDSRINYLQNAITLTSSNDYALRELSASYLTKALLKFRELSSSIDSSKDESINISIKRQELINNIQNSIFFAKKAIATSPENYINYQNIANIYESLMNIGTDGAFEAAVQNYKLALEKSKNYPPLMYAIARVYLKQINSLNQLAQNLKDSKENKAKKQQIEKNISSYIKEAKSYLQKALNLKPDYSIAYELLAQLNLLENDINSAVENYKIALSFNPNNQFLLYRIGALYYSNNDFENAKVFLQRAISINNNYSDARFLLGNIYLKENKKEKALEEFRKVYELNKDNKDLENLIKSLEKSSEK